MGKLVEEIFIIIVKQCSTGSYETLKNKEKESNIPFKAQSLSVQVQF